MLYGNAPFAPGGTWYYGVFKFRVNIVDDLATYDTVSMGYRLNLLVNENHPGLDVNQQATAVKINEQVKAQK